MVRARKHASVGAWLETAVGERGEEFADALAHHFEQAVLLADASGERREADGWRSHAATWLSTAGEVALRLDPAGAFARNERVLAITTEEDPRYVQALAHSALAGRRSALLSRDEVLRRQQQVVAIYVANGDRVAEARGRASLGGQLMAMARREEARREFATAAELLAGEPEAASELALVRAWMAEDEMFSGNPGPAADYADQALATGAANEQVAIMALHIRGDSRIALGDPDGIEDLHEALDRAQSLGSVSEIITSYSYIADIEWQVQGPALALQRLDEGSALADRRGAFSQGSWSKVAALELLVELGRWDEVLTRALPLTDDERMDESLVVAVDIWTTVVRLRRRQLQGDVEALLARARGVEEIQVVAPALAVAAEAAFAAGIGAGRGACGGVRNGDPRQGIDVSIGIGGVGDPHRSGRGRARDSRRSGGPLGTGHVGDELFVETAVARLREAEGAVEPAVWAHLERRWHDYGEGLRGGARRGRSSDARRATPSRRHEALRCSPRSGCPGSAWNFSPVDPEEEAQLEIAAPSGAFAGSQGRDFKTLAVGTAENIVGLVVFVVGTFGGTS